MLFLVVSNKLRSRSLSVIEAVGFKFIQYMSQWNKLEKGVRRTSIRRMWWPLLSFCLEEVRLHLHDALWKIAWNFSEAFTAAVHNVVVAGAAGWTHCNLRDTRPRLRQCRTCRKRRKCAWLSLMVTRLLSTCSLKIIWTDMKAGWEENPKWERQVCFWHVGARVVCNGGCKQKKKKKKRPD